MFLEYPRFRIVHACWHEAGVGLLKTVTQSGVLTDEQFIQASRKDDPLCQLVETATKGPEVKLPDGLTIADKDGHRRSEVRLRWWARDAKTWAEFAISVPNEDDLPKSAPPTDLLRDFYPSDAKPVFVGHYWLTESPVLQANNILCLDYSAGTDGTLVSYLMEDGHADQGLDRLTVHG